MNENYKITVEYKNGKIETALPSITKGNFKQRIKYSDHLLKIAEVGNEMVQNQKENKLEITIKIKELK